MQAINKQLCPILFFDSMSKPFSMKYLESCNAVEELNENAMPSAVSPELVLTCLFTVMSKTCLTVCKAWSVFGF